MHYATLLMHLCFISIITVIFISNSVNPLSLFNHVIETYEITDYQVFSIPGMKKEDSGTSDIEIVFRSFKKKFHLILHEDLKFQEISLNDTLLQNIKTKFYEGILKENPLDSFVIGYLRDSYLSALVQNGEKVYYVEPASLFLQNPEYSRQIVVYQDKNVVDRNMYPPNQFYQHKNLLLNSYFDPNENSLPRGVDQSKYLSGKLACHIEMVADHTLYEFYKKDEAFVTAFLYFHAKYADNIFRRTDFNGDGKPDKIRIIVEKIFIYKSVNEKNYPMAYTKDLKSFLYSFSRRRQNYCLSVGMCYKRDPSSPAIGQAFKPGIKPNGPPGGICQKPRRFFSSYSHLNTAAVTVKSSRYTTLPLITTLLAVAHEIGHSFGSDHDPLYDLSCTPGGRKGFYLMFEKAVSWIKPRNSYFSPCSRKQIYRTILTRGECLKEYSATCGNGIKEGIEECDCGSTKLCNILDHCCTPSDAIFPEEGCKYRRQQDSQCSPREDKCCSKHCKVIDDTNVRCYYDDQSCRISYCNGRNGTCPKPVPAPDKYPCQKLSKTCYKGACTSTICRDHGLGDCVSGDYNKQCFVSCLKGNHCLPANDLGFRTPTDENYVLEEGTPCYHTKRQCDGAGSCVHLKFRKLDIDDNGGHTAAWWSLTIVSVVFMVLILILCHILRRSLSSR